MLVINTHSVSGRLAKDPALSVIAMKDGEAKTVVVINLVYHHPHDARKKVMDRRAQYVKVRVYGKTAEAAQKYLRKGDEVAGINCTRVQDSWEDRTTKMMIRAEYYEPPPMGLQYLRVRSMGLGTPFRDERE